MTGHKAVRFNFHTVSRGRDKSPWPSFFATLTLIKNCAISTEGAGKGGKQEHASRELFLFMFHWYGAISPSGPHRTDGVVFRRDRSIDFPRVSSRCPRLNEVTDFQWPAAAWMTGALLANSTLNLHSNVIKRATTFETRVLSSNREERRVLCVRALAVWISLRLKSSRYNYCRNKHAYVSRILYYDSRLYNLCVALLPAVRVSGCSIFE